MLNNLKFKFLNHNHFMQYLMVVNPVRGSVRVTKESHMPSFLLYGLVHSKNKVFGLAHNSTLHGPTSSVIH